MYEIEIENLTKKFSNDKGIFDVSFSVSAGQVVGFLGPNGAGKTTTIRHLMGLVKPDSGTIKIDNKDCFLERADLQKIVGYLAGESCFPKSLKASDMIDMIKGLKKMSFDKSNDLLERFGLNPKTSIKTMSLGEKKKLGIILAFMSEPNVLILDEPTNGLDPLLQKEFHDLLVESRERGATILMSSHRFDEIESICNSVVMIKDGRIVSNDLISNIKRGQGQYFTIGFNTSADVNEFSEKWGNAQLNGNTVRVFVTSDKINNFIKLVNRFEINSLECEEESLSDFFMRYYEKGEN